MHFLGIDCVQRGDRPGVSGFGEKRDHAGCHIQPPRLEHHRHDSQPPHQVICGIRCRPPHSGMRGQGTVMTARRFKTVAHQVEMFGFFVCCFDPVVVVADGKRHMGKSCDDIPMQVDGIQFDMGHSMQQCDSPQGRTRAAAGHIARVQQHRQGRTGGRVRRCGIANRDGLARRPGVAPACGMGPRQGRFGAAIGGGQYLDGHVGQGLHDGPCSGLQLRQQVGNWQVSSRNLPDGACVIAP